MRPTGWRSRHPGPRVACRCRTSGAATSTSSRRSRSGSLTFVWVVTALSLGLGTLIIWIGVPILIAFFEANRGFATLERRRVGWLLSEPIPSAYLPQQRRGMFGYLRTKLGDAAVWKDLVWLAIILPVFGLAGFILAVTFWSAMFGTLLLPVWYWSIPDGLDYGVITIDTLEESWIGVPIGLVLLAITVPLTRAWATASARSGAACSRRASAAA